jgi:hypothetical protein
MSVDPSPDAARLLVNVAAGADVGPEEVLDRLERSSGRLRSEVATRPRADGERRSFLSNTPRRSRSCFMARMPIYPNDGKEMDIGLAVPIQIRPPNCGAKRFWITSEVYGEITGSVEVPYSSYSVERTHFHHSRNRRARHGSTPKHAPEAIHEANRRRA